MDFFIQLVLQSLLTLNNWFGSLGLAIIIFTIIFRLVILAFTYKSLKSMKKMRALQGELKQLQRKHKGDPQALNKAQLELYQKHNLNPLSGCLPQLLQIVMLIIFYQALLQLINLEGITNVQFLWFNLTQIDSYRIIPLLATVSQLFLSLMIAPGAETPDVIPNDSKSKKIQELNKQEEDSAQMAATMQKQMVFMMPFLSGLVAWNLPAGLGFYWIVSTLFSIGQQYFISGWGGLALYATRIRQKFS